MYCNPPRRLWPWNFSGKNTKVGCHFLLQRIFLIQGLNLRLLHLLHWQAVSLPLVPPGKHFRLPLPHNQQCTHRVQWLKKKITERRILREHSSDATMVRQHAIKESIKALVRQPWSLISTLLRTSFLALDKFSSSLKWGWWRCVVKTRRGRRHTRFRRVITSRKGRTRSLGQEST